MHMRRIVSYLGLQDCLISVARSQLGNSESDKLREVSPSPFILLLTELQVTDYSHKLKKALDSVLLKQEAVARSVPYPFILLITELQVTDYSHKLKKALDSVLLKQEAVARSVPLPFHTVNNGITGYRLLAQTKEST